MENDKTIVEKEVVFQDQYDEADTIRPKKIYEPEEEVVDEVAEETMEEPVTEVREEEVPVVKLSAAEQHLLDIQSKIEESKNSSLYDTYEYLASKADPGVELYWVRRQGRGHIRKGTPCQDYCQVSECMDSIILTDADGVSSCDRSDVGSKVACETAIEMISSLRKKYDSEEEFVSVINSVKFRKNLLLNWINNIKKYIQPESSIQEEFQRFGSTLMYVVVTPNWYVCGNLGDGQILLFNEEESTKVRVHGQKESSRVHSLVSEKCFLEDFQTGIYSRKRFNGVLLSSDGMYDILGGGVNFFTYAKQLKARFQAKKEPFLPFCFVDGEEGMKDLYNFRTQDDCSVAMFIDNKPLPGEALEVYKGLMEQASFAVLNRTASGKSLYVAKLGEKYYNVLAAEAKEAVDQEIELTTASVISPCYGWEKEGISYSVYEDVDFESFESLFSNGKLREQKRLKHDSSNYIWELYCKMESCRRELREKGLVLGEGAHFLMGIHPATGELMLYRGGISSAKTAAQNTTLRNYFESMLGAFEILGSTGQNYPVFSTGYIAKGPTYMRFELEEDVPFFRISYKMGEYFLENMGSSDWVMEDGSVVSPGERVSLTEGLLIKILGDHGEAVYRYHAKETV